MKRRNTLFALLALGLDPLVSRAQQQDKVWRVGFLTQRRRPDSIDGDFIGAFPREMRELGYVEGKNLVIEWRFDDRSERLPELAAELVRLKLDVIVSGSSQAISALQKATTTIPIVMATSGDPIGSGFVKSLAARPGGNITGFQNRTSDIGTKQLELLLGMVPKLSRVAVLVNPVNPALGTFLKNVQSAAQGSSVKVLPVEARTAQEIENAFRVIAQEKAEAVIVATDALLIEHYRKIAELAATNRLPSSSTIR